VAHENRGLRTIRFMRTGVAVSELEQAGYLEPCPGPASSQNNRGAQPLLLHYI